SHPFLFSTPPPTTQLSTLSLHDALPILGMHAKRSTHDYIKLGLPGATPRGGAGGWGAPCRRPRRAPAWHMKASNQGSKGRSPGRSEEHTSELQSPCNLVCRLLLEKKKQK